SAASSTSSRSSPARPSTRPASGPSLGAAPGGPPGGLMGVLIEDLRGEYRSAVRRRKDERGSSPRGGGRARARFSFRAHAVLIGRGDPELRAKCGPGARLDTGDGASLYP